MDRINSEIYNSGQLVTTNIVSLDIMNTVNKVPYARVVVAEGEGEQEKATAMSKLQCFKPGEVLEIALTTEAGAGKFKGVVVKHNIRKRSDKTLLTIDVKHPAYKLTLLRNSAVFTEKSDLDVMKEIAQEMEVSVNCNATTLMHKQLVQYYCTPWDFIVSRAEANGLMVCPDIDAETPSITLKKPEFGGASKELKEIYEYELEADLTGPYKSVEATCWDIKEVKPKTTAGTEQVVLQGKLAAEANTVSLDKNTLVTGAYGEEEEMKAWANAAILKRQHSLLRGRVTIKGNAQIKLGDTVNFAGEGTVFYGDAVVSGIRHRIDQEGWVTDIQCGLNKNWFYKNDDVVEKPAAGLLPGVNGLQIGIVEAYPSDGDPDSFHRIQVRIPAVDETQSVIWARLLYPYAGEERGMFFVPEEGDEVVIGFFNDDPRHAVVLGSLHNGKSAPPLEITEDNNEKGIVTRNGIKMVFTDEDDKEKIEISTPGGNTILIEDENGINIQDSNENKVVFTDEGVAFEDKNANKVTTDDAGIIIEDLNKNTFTLSSEGIKIEDANGNTITMDSAGINLTDLSGNKLVLEAAGATVESSANVTVKGTAVEIN